LFDSSHRFPTLAAMPSSNGRNQEANGGKRKEKPIPFKLGSFTATIYITMKKVDGIDYRVWRPAYYLPDGRRVVRDCGSLERALEILQEVGQAFGRAQPDALEITARDRRDLDAAQAILQPMGLSLYEAATRLREATQLLPQGVSLLDAVRQAVARHPRTDRMVGEVVSEIIRDRQANARSDKYLKDMSGRLHQFARAFAVPISSVTAAAVRSYIQNLRNPDRSPLAPRSRENHRRLIVTLFEYAAQQGYVARDTAADIANIAAPRVVADTTGIFTPEQIRKILPALDGTDRVILALAAFCGLRSAELNRLEWRNVRVDQRVVVVDAGQTKTASRRVVPLPENAVAWIAPLIPTDASGRISRHDHPDYQGEVFSKTAQGLNIKWVRNGLRHSWCSYRLAMTKNAALTSHEAGNSPGVLHRNYNELVTEAEANEWFNVLPE